MSNRNARLRPLLHVVLALLLLGASSAGAGTDVAYGEGTGGGLNDGAVTYEGSTGTIDFGYGSVQFAQGSAPKLTGVRHQSIAQLWNGNGTESQSGSAGDIELTHAWGSGAQLTELRTSLKNAPDGSLAIRQEASALSAGMTGIQWGLAVPDSYDLIIPAFGGIKLSADTPNAAYGFQQFNYPDIWEAQMFLIQGEQGGLLVHAEDNGVYFKSLHVKHEAGFFHIGVETYSPAPFSQVAEADTPNWRLRAYEGDWINGAVLYRDWAATAFGLAVPALRRWHGRRTFNSPS